MLYLKSCPRCSGDMYMDRDAYGSYRQCFQCGYVRDLAEQALAAPRAVERPLGRRRSAVA